MKKSINPSQFEAMVRDCAEIKYLQDFTLTSRFGTYYRGDVVSQDRKTLIECKCYPNKGRASYNLLVTNTKKAYDMACYYNPKMALFVVATTLDRDLPTLEAIQKNAGQVPIETLFWDELTSLYERFEEKYTLSRYMAVIAQTGDDYSEEAILKAYKKYRDLSYSYGYGASFSNGIIIPKREYIVPEPEIISGITFVNDSLLQQVKTNPMIMHQFTSREFEKMVCELFDQQGFNVSLTKQTHDGGKDLVVLRKDSLGEFCIYIDCKKFSPSHPVGVGLVRELYGTIEADRVTAGQIVTTSYFSKEAKEFTEKVKYRMSLMDFDGIVRALEDM